MSAVYVLGIIAVIVAGLMYLGKRDKEEQHH